jgi:CheY-like chemotaxis protein
MEYGTKRILIADDDPDFLFQISFRIRKMGFEVYATESQKETENLLEQFHPDLAIFDLRLEHHDSGFRLTDFINRKYPGVPVIVASSDLSGLKSGNQTAMANPDLLVDKNKLEDMLQQELTRLLKL